MCGIVGVISCEKGAGSFDRDKFMRQALICGTLRGYDSTGLIMVDQQEKVDTFKHTFAGYDFAQLKFVNRVISNTQDYKVLIGHHRFKTNGNVSRFEAHPHEYGNITLVHNGGIENSYQLPGYRHDKEEPIVDTFRLTKAFGIEGADKVLPFIEGAYALVWWDAKEKALYMTRNAQRPLAIIWSENKKSVFIASEWEMLAWLMKRNQIKTEKNCKTLQEMVLYKFKINDNSIDMEKTSYIKNVLSRPDYSENIRHRFYPGLGTAKTVNMADPDFDYRDAYGEDDLEWEPGNAGPKHSPVGASPQPQLALPGVNRNKNIVKPIIVAQEPHGPQHPIITVLSPHTEQKPTGKKMERIQRLLQDYHLVYGASIWCIPDSWSEYKGNGTGQGVARFLYGPSHIEVQIHNVSQEEWGAVLASGLLTATVIIDVTHNKQTLVGKIDWEGQQGYETFLATIDMESNFKFIPFKASEYITKAEFYRRTHLGCSSCKQPIKLVGADRTEWLDDMPVCGDCSGQLPAEKEMLDAAS